MEFEVPLNQLYEIVAGCFHTEGSNFCGVLVRIRDRKTLMLNDGKPYLLQIWKRGGTMVFEKSLNRPICNWNVTTDKFIFQEEPTRPEVYLISLYLNA